MMIGRKSTVLLLATILYALRLAPAQGHTQATLVESEADSTCALDCPPLPLPKVYGVYVYCLSAGDQFLIGEHQMWEIGLSNLARLNGQSLTTRWDQKHIWVTLPSGWTARLNQYNYEYYFRNLDCRSAAELRSLQHGYTRPQPVPGEPAQPVMHGDLVYGWALCSYMNLKLFPLDGQPNGDRFKCKVWDLAGLVRQDAVFEMIQRNSPAPWDESVDGEFLRLHLRGGKTLERTSSSSVPGE